MPSAVSNLKLAISASALGLLVAACHPPTGGLTGVASDEWVRSYPLAAGGEIEIINTIGAIDVEGGDGGTVEVRAERIARATTDALARELVPRIAIREDVTSDKVTIRTEGIDGLLIGAGYEVRYSVRAPRASVVRARTRNGTIGVKAFRGRVVVTTTNGGVAADELSGGVEARTVNGNVRVGLTAVGADLVDLRTTNGNVQLTLPETTNANLLASCRNGRVDVTGLTLTFDAMGEQSSRRVRGRLNGGGTPIEVATVNGNIRIASAGGNAETGGSRP
jgi:hypothetical protein